MERLRPRTAGLPAALRLERRATSQSMEKVWSDLGKASPAAASRAALAGAAQASAYARSIENYAGTVKVPFGIAGPLRVNGLHAHGDYLIPLTTTEAALVASYARGAHAALAAVSGQPVLAIEGDKTQLADWHRRACGIGAIDVVAVDAIPLDTRHRSKVDDPQLARKLASQR